MRLITDTRNGVHNLDAEVPDADVNMALDWFSKLDGKRHTLMSLERKDGWQLMIGGGPLRYVVTLGNDIDNLTLENMSGNQSTMVELCAGGQYGDYPETICVNPEQAANAVSLFFLGLEQQLQWAK
ncbi:hypothetical protein G6L94_00725 [Agrobacterium rhizogenes]|uniref:hypothetical protein n=1 Tax=Rhizobium TaxID=379 RepID=UPI00026ED812|nr:MULTISPECIES: hypothetical protein [Rhizobium]OCJ19913.1 hypothetical protein A6U89_33540 [Agrobacterium sp. B133/95]OCJ23398.1 hypothetical protein A6U88_28905 [Agrobacterium sp. B131/95]EJK84360.1 hypothetical protein PMI03_02704 [Rhizobium sp. AP16]MDJ1638492.1 hypothetical protein [Rhizobium rhizogenes]NTG71837.1 hypothetical protein [Rhizobium rhizogenes]